jgi:Rrf2 family iron-sulfur cluster assembly transcriptional regulator
MRLTTKGRYGMRAIVHLATSEDEHPVSISQIAEQEDVSPEFLEQIFFKLKKSGVIRSVRGPKGGFLLNTAPQDLTVKTILDAVGESICLVACTTCDSEQTCPLQPRCKMAPFWQSFYELLECFLQSVSLQDIIERNCKDDYLNVVRKEGIAV